jgi:hypothetical protein
MVATMTEINFVRSIDLSDVAYKVCREVDWTPLEKLGLYPVQVNLLGYTHGDKDIPVSIIVKYDQELHDAVARHE